MNVVAPITMRRPRVSDWTHRSEVSKALLAFRMWLEMLRGLIFPALRRYSLIGLRNFGLFGQEQGLRPTPRNGCTIGLEPRRKGPLAAWKLKKSLFISLIAGNAPSSGAVADPPRSSALRIPQPMSVTAAMVSAASWRNELGKLNRINIKVIYYLHFAI